MDTPRLVIVPATPSSYSVSPRSAIPATPATAPNAEERESSETAIVAIYSMYGDDVDVEKKSSFGQTRILPSHPETYRKLPLAPLSPRPLPSVGTMQNRRAVNRAVPQGSGRPGSNHSSVSSVPGSFETARSSSENRERPVIPPSPPAGGRSRSRSPRRRPPSPDRKSAFINRDLPPVPMTPEPPRSRPTTPKTEPSRTPPPPMQLPHTPSLSRNPSKRSDLGSKRSLTPRVGEDPDSFLVRSVYAQLEVQGVKGDGYEDGVERTRAKVANALNGPTLAMGEKTGDLSLKEIETLSNLDRYGFFSIPSHDRLVLLPSAQLLKPLAILRPRIAPTNTQPLDSLPPLTLPRKETSRISKWNRMLLPSCRDAGGNIESWAIKSSKERKLRERIYKGIPDRWRNAAWDLLMSRYSGTGKSDVQRWVGEYKEALERPSSYDIQIDLDVPRTISGHVMFRTRYGAGQRALFHVLHSFSLRCPICGYVQGMGPIAATLLCYYEPERVYASLVRLHDAYDLHRLFSPGFPGLLEAIYLQERITEQMMPEVYIAFRKHMISTTSYATKWYITLFSNTVPFQTQLRLWDAFMLEGPDVFVVAAVAIVWVYKDQISAPFANLETVLSLLSSFFVPQDENVLLSWIGKTLADKKLRANITRWKADWQVLVRKGEDGKALL